MSASNPTLELLPSPLLITWIVLGDVWANFASSRTVRFFSSLARRNLLPIAGPSCFVRLATVGQCIHRLDCATTVGESVSCNFLLAQNIMVSNYILVHGDALVLISRSFPMLPDQIWLRGVIVRDYPADLRNDPEGQAANPNGYCYSLRPGDDEQGMEGFRSIHGGKFCNRLPEHDKPSKDAEGKVIGATPCSTIPF